MRRKRRVKGELQTQLYKVRENIDEGDTVQSLAFACAPVSDLGSDLDSDEEVK